MPQVLILHFDAQQYRDRLAGRFSNVEFHAVHHGEEANAVIADVDVIMGLGHHIPPPLIAKAQEAEMGAGADHGHRDADRAGRAAARMCC